MPSQITMRITSGSGFDTIVWKFQASYHNYHRLEVTRTSFPTTTCTCIDLLCRWIPWSGFSDCDVPRAWAASHFNQLICSCSLQFFFSPRRSRPF
jgi:hypothetical protein